MLEMNFSKKGIFLFNETESRTSKGGAIGIEDAFSSKSPQLFAKQFQQHSMNIPTSNTTATPSEAESLHPYYEEATAPFPTTAPSQPAPFRTKKTLVLETGAEIASHRCLKTGRPTKHRVTLSLRNPWKPATWFVPHGKIEIGLSRQSLENCRITRTIAWALIGGGIILAAASYTYGLSALVAGLLLTLTGFMIRAAFPVWCSTKNEHALVIQGCGEDFLRQYPEKSVV